MKLVPRLMLIGPKHDLVFFCNYELFFYKEVVE